MPSSASGNQTCALRSEEHTSELKSHDNLVCRLLLEKIQTQLTHHFAGSLIVAPYTCSKTINWADNDGIPRIQWPGSWYLFRGPAGHDNPPFLPTPFPLE